MKTGKIPGSKPKKSNPTNKDQNQVMKPGCNLSDVGKVFYQYEGKRLCAICSEHCAKPNPETSKVLANNIKNRKCDCLHVENRDFFIKITNMLAEQLENKEFDNIPMLNIVTSRFIENNAEVAASFEELQRNFEQDVKELRNNTFQWSDFTPDEIKKKLHIFTYIFNSNIESVSSYKLYLLETAFIKRFINLEFISISTNFPNYSFGDPIYNTTLNFYTSLLLFFNKFYLEQDLLHVEKIFSANIEQSSLFYRQNVRMNNRKNPSINKKYLTEAFNINSFALKCVSNFIPGATWRWIGGHHKCHFYSIKICKNLIEIGLFEDSELDQLIQVLFDKYENLLSLEKVIDGEKVHQFWTKIWAADLALIREFVCEIILHTLYLYRDREVLKIYAEKSRIKKPFNKMSESELESLVESRDLTSIKNTDYVRKIMSIFFGYVLSPNNIQKFKMLTENAQKLVMKIMPFFFKMPDAYQQSLLLSSENYFSFYSSKYIIKSIRPEESDLAVVQQFSEKISEIFKNTRSGDLEKQSNIDEFNKFLSGFREHLEAHPRRQDEYVWASLTHSYFELGMPCKLMHLLALFTEWTNVPENIVENLFESMLLLASDSTFNYDFFVTNLNYLEFIEKLLPSFPFACLGYLKKLMSKNKLSFIISTSLFEVLLNFTKERLTELAHDSEESAVSLRLMKIIAEALVILSEYLDYRMYSQFFTPPVYDLHISKVLVSVFLQDLVKKGRKIVERLQSSLEIVNASEANEKFIEFFMQFLKTLNLSMSFRFKYDVYHKLENIFKLKNLIDLVALAQGTKAHCGILLDLISILYIDFKNCLLTERTKYFFTKPLDMQYEEDIFYETEYSEILQLLIKQFELFRREITEADSQERTEELKKFAEKHIFAHIIKMLNFFMIFRDQDLFKIKKHAPTIEHLYDLLYKAREELFKIFSSSERINLKNIEELEQSLAEYTLEKKREKIAIRVFSLASFEILSKIIRPGNLEPHKKKSLSQRAPELKVQHLFQHDRMPEHKKNKITTFSSYVAHFYFRNKQEKQLPVLVIKGRSDAPREAFSLVLNLGSFLKRTIAHSHENPSAISQTTKLKTLLQGILNPKYFSPRIIQDMIEASIKSISDDQNEEAVFLDNLWMELKTHLGYVRFKTTTDKYWRDSYELLLQLFAFHQFLCKYNNIYLKNFSGTAKLPNDSIDRVQRYTTIFQKMSDNHEWNYGYTAGSLDRFQRHHRQYVFMLAANVFRCIIQSITYSYIPNQKRIYTFIYDRYNGNLKRNAYDKNSKFFEMKLSLVSFICAMAEGYDRDIIYYQTTNFEFTTLRNIMKNSLKQLYHFFAPSSSYFSNSKMESIDDLRLMMKDYPTLIQIFLDNPEFSRHPLFKISFKIFSYIKHLSFYRNNFAKYEEERERALLFKQERKDITEDDLVCYKFWREHVRSLEIKSISDGSVKFVYYPRLPKVLFLSKETKCRFERTTVDHGDAKFNKFLKLSTYFEQEMDHNLSKYRLSKRVIYDTKTEKLKLRRYMLDQRSVFFAYLILNILLIVENNWKATLPSEEGIKEFVIKLFVITIFKPFNFLVTNHARGMESILGLLSCIMATIAIYHYYISDANYLLRLYKNALKWEKPANTESKLGKFLSFVWEVAGLLWIAFFSFVTALLNSKAFFVVGLLSCIFIFPSFQRPFVLRKKYLRKLLGTAIGMGVLFLHVYLIFSYFDSRNAEFRKKLRCESGLECALKLLDSLNNFDTQNPMMYIGLLVTVLFFIATSICVTKLIVCVFHFSYLDERERLREIRNNFHDRCFICTIERSFFAQQKIDFDLHISQAHNLWKYIEYMVYVRSLEEHECDGTEEEVRSLLETYSYNWLPINRSLSLEGKDLNRKELQWQQLESRVFPRLTQKMGEIKTGVKSLEEEIQKLKQAQPPVQPLLQEQAHNPFQYNLI